MADRGDGAADDAAAAGDGRAASAHDDHGDSGDVAKRGSGAAVTDHEGGCYCGAVRFVATCVPGADCVTSYCHCESCRRAHASPVYQFVWLRPEHFRVVAGEERVVRFQRDSEREGDDHDDDDESGVVPPVRAFCGTCGSRVFNVYESGAFGMFPALLDDSGCLPEQWRPACHNFVGEAMALLGVLDKSLPRHVDTTVAVPSGGTSVTEAAGGGGAADKDREYEGGCYCGAVRFASRADASEGTPRCVYCHCKSCRRAHSAPVYQVVWQPESCFRVLAGDSTVRCYTKAGPARSFCGTCGSRVFNRFPKDHPASGLGVAMFPALLDEYAALPDEWKPTLHVNTGEAMGLLELVIDELPRRGD